MGQNHDRHRRHRDPSALEERVVLSHARGALRGVRHRLREARDRARRGPRAAAAHLGGRGSAGRPSRPGRWTIARGDFRAECDLARGRGRVRQSANPYAIDSLLRVLHTPGARPRGRLPRARGERGARRAGVPVRRRLGCRQDHDLASRPARRDAAHATRSPTSAAPGRATRLTARPSRASSRARERTCARRWRPSTCSPRARRTASSRSAPPTPPAGFSRAILFFAEDPELVKQVFAAACELVARVPVRRLTFVPDARAWDLVR